MDERDATVDLAIKAAGSTTALARLLGVSSQAISQWDRVPYKHILAIADLTGLDPRDVRRNAEEDAE